jgi:hypothetical protein
MDRDRDVTTRVVENQQTVLIPFRYYNETAPTRGHGVTG